MVHIVHTGISGPYIKRHDYASWLCVMVCTYGCLHAQPWSKHVRVMGSDVVQGGDPFFSAPRFSNFHNSLIWSLSKLKLLDCLKHLFLCRYTLFNFSCYISYSFSYFFFCSYLFSMFFPIFAVHCKTEEEFFPRFAVHCKMGEEFFFSSFPCSSPIL